MDGNDCLELQLWRLGIPVERDSNKNVFGRFAGLTVRAPCEIEGQVPLAWARRIHALDVYKQMWVRGHCGAPHPDEYVTWRDADGREIADQPDDERRFRHACSMPQYHWVARVEDVPDRRGFIESYSIRSMEAFHVFVRAIRLLQSEGGE